MRSVLFAVIAICIAPSQMPCAMPVCSCVEGRGVNESVERADAVFVARVIAIRDTSIYWVQRQRSYPARFATLAVSAAWKGISEPTATISVGEGRGDCTYAFTLNEEYLIFARGRANSLSTSMCERTRRVALAREDLAVLGPPVRRWDYGIPRLPR